MRRKGEHLRVPAETVSEITGVELHQLLEWEKVFHPHLRPERSGAYRLYTPADVEMVVTIKRLLNSGSFTAEGVKRALCWTLARAA